MASGSSYFDAPNGSSSSIPSAIPATVRVDMAHDRSPANYLPPISRNPSLAAALQAVQAAGASLPAHVVKIGTRASALALIQATAVQAELSKAHPGEQFAITPMSVAGDRNKIEPLYLMGGKALWTKDLEVGLLEGAIDCIVHCLKDVPTSLPEGCTLAAVLEREDPRDALVAKKGSSIKSLAELQEGSCIGSSSVRRVAQLRRAFPHLVFKDVRGNIDTRLAKLDDPEGPFDALILASAGLLRSNRDERITEYLSGPTMLYATGQGALTIEVRSDDERMKAMISSLNHPATELATSCERSLLRTLEGGCSVPVGVETVLSPDGQTLHLSAVIASLDGKECIAHEVERQVASLQEAEELGKDVAYVLIERGGKKILEDLGRIVAEKGSKGINEAVREKEVEKEMQEAQLHGQHEQMQH